MRTSHLVTAIALSAGLLATGVTIAPAFAQNAPIDSAATASTAERGNWLSIPQIHDKVVAAGYRDISEIEREDNAYEVKAIDRDGRKVKLVVDPTNGDLVRADRKGRDGRRGDDSGARSTSDSDRDTERDNRREDGREAERGTERNSEFDPSARLTRPGLGV
ncbi:PepSY domain-containing protein [Aromatoleum buckelii]|uniref:PepSY domain-containing protein n=1 Tax=Aromatoleum buckelii TaxID=200254 RepID=A0ABX1N4F0_9RHOO|nr:PepSY domain-containing protein [Aromatoleum buckelii]MCK0512523.1 PepSY domain-containing protein [Aromatoleum buckelii]